MAAEDWIDFHDYLDAEFEIHYGDDIPFHQKRYTDRFTFNGRRLRTDKQKEIQMGQFSGLMKTGARTGASYELEDLVGQEVVIKVEKFPLLTKEAVECNKFYISSPTVFINNWGHPTLDETIKHAQDMLQKRKDVNEIAIVEIVRIVRRKPIEVDIETV